MKVHFFFFISCMVLSISLSAQSFKNHLACGHDLVLNTMEAQYPGYKDQVLKTFENAKKRSRNETGLRREQLTIPVVIHIVWKEDAENISDELIEKQVRALNEAFNLENENKDDIRDIFKDRQADANIFFDLIEIKRRKTTANFALSFTLGLPDDVKRARNGSAAVEPANVLNIWICKIQPIPFIGAQILGFAYPPAGLANWPAGANAPSEDLDGVVLDFRAVGPDNPNVLDIAGVPFDAQGRTMVHEVGHYLGLRHIWGDGSILGGSSCGEDDGVDDTPNQGESSDFTCDLQQNTCMDAENDLPDMIENYMDYSSESCQNTFTEGQVAIMRSVIMNERRGLISSAKNHYLAQSVKVYPNPTMDILYIDAGSEWQKVEILNLQGNVQQSLTHYQEYIDVAPLTPGTYLVKIQYKDSASWNKFVKM